MEFTVEQVQAMEAVLKAFGITRFVLIGANTEFTLKRTVQHQMDNLQAATMCRLEAQRLETIFTTPVGPIKMVKQ